MEVQFRPRGDGWRGRGRPRNADQPVPDEIILLVRRTYETRDQAEIPTAGATPGEVRQVMALIKRGAEQLGWSIRIQGPSRRTGADPFIRFYVEDNEA